MRLFVLMSVSSLLTLQAARADDFTVTARAFADGARLPMAQVKAGPSCGGGGDLSPALTWSTPTDGAESLAVTAFDPDARAGKGWWHWALTDLPPSLRALPEGAGKPELTPAGAKEAVTSFGSPGYGGACPPAGPAHHYVFTIWALRDPRLPPGAGTNAEAIGAWLAAHALGRATVTAVYGR